MEKRKKFWMEACALREAGSHEAGRVLVHWEAPSQGGPKGSCGISESWAKRGLIGQKTEKIALLSPSTALGLWIRPDGRLREPREDHRSPMQRSGLGRRGDDRAVVFKALQCT